MSGCQRSTGTPGTTAGGQQADQNAQVLDEIRRTGQSVEALAEEVKRQRSLEAEKAGDPPVVRDLAVARGALSEAQKAVEAKNAEACQVAVQRLRRVLQSLAAELPAALIAQYADRALYEVKAQQAIGSKQFVNASLELAAASNIKSNGRPQELVPAVEADLDNARKALEKNDGNAAIQALEGMLKRALDHGSLHTVVNAQAAARGAEEALARQAWPVVSAELAELDTQLGQIVATPSATSTTPTTTPSTSEATGAAGGPASPTPPTTTPAAGATTPPAAAAPPAAASPPPASQPVRP